MFTHQGFTGSRSVELELRPGGKEELRINIPDVAVGDFWARAVMNGDMAGAQLSAYVSGPDTVTIIAQNLMDRPVHLMGRLFVECGFV